jgi:predicted nicotinamide N-methyase
MQLHFNPDELHLLWEVLLDWAPGHDDLLQMVLAHDLRFDCEQMDRLGDVLAQCRGKMEESVRTGDTDRRESVNQKLTLLTRMQERVQEASAMV